MIRKSTGFVCIRCDSEYGRARDGAIEEATRILSRVRGVTEKEARLYVTTVGDLRNGAVWAVGKTGPQWIDQMVCVVGLDVPLYDDASAQGSRTQR